MPDLHVWLADRDGYLVGELDAVGVTVDLATYRADAAKNGHTVIEKGVDPAATRPKVRPDPLDPKRAKLDELRVKGWANLSAAERDEAMALRFDLGL